MKIRYRAASLIVLLLFCSILVLLRKPYVSKDVNPGNTAHAFMLTTLNVWQKEGVLIHHAAAIQTWTSKADQYMHYYKRLEDKEGHNYYISHPPFAFQFAALVFACFNEAPNQIGLQRLLLFLLLSSAFLIAWIVKRELVHDDATASMLGVAAAIVYLFVPVNIYAFTFHYFSETLGQFFFVTSIASLVYFKHSDRPILSQLMLAISVFLLSYTDWMGIPFVICLLIIYKGHRKEAFYRRMIWIVGSSAALAYLLVFIQYISISGFESLYRALGIRFLERSGYFGPHYTDMQLDISNIESWKLLAVQIHELLIGPGYLIVAAVAVGLVFHWKKKVICCSNWPKTAAVAFFVPLSYLLVLFSATVTHYVYIAKFSPFVAIMAGYAFHRLYGLMRKKTYFLFLLFAAVSISAAFGFLGFQSHLYKPKTHDKLIKDLSIYICNKVSQQEAIFVKPINSVPESAIIYLSFAAQRSICYAKDFEEASKLAIDNKQSNFVFIEASLNDSIRFKSN